MLYGNLNDDDLYGNLGNDSLFGGQDADALYGGQGNDLMFGDRGEDSLHGDRGNDVLVGGADNDLFAFGTLTDADTITDFEVTGGDQIQIAGVTSFAQVQGLLGSDPTGNAVITISAGHTVTLLGVSASQLTASEFSFG